jgi:hypothetical protein
LLQFEGFIQQDFGFAATAFWMVVEALGGDAVEAVAVGAGDEEWVGHGWLFESWQSMRWIWRQSPRLSRQRYVGRSLLQLER